MSIPAQHCLGPIREEVEAVLDRLQQGHIIQRIWDRDHTVWKPDPTEITNRLGWLDSPRNMSDRLGEIRSVVDAVRRDGYTHALLLGMGGSSLAPEVFRLIFGVQEGYLDLGVLDSTDPGAVLAHDRRLDPVRTLFIPATKSGGTVETFSFLKYFYNRTLEAAGADQAGAHFAAITDPGGGLAELAEEREFRHTFLNDPDIGGRYSVLSLFGLVPAGLIGMDLEKLLQRARDMAENADEGALLGAVLGAGVLAGRDKVTLIASPPIAPFGAWVEQLIAESTGKEGKGILPVDQEPLADPDSYGDDRIFAYLRLAGDDTYDRAVQALADAGHPVVRLDLDDLYDLGGEFFRWELATSIAGHCLQINPFDQPNVEAAKVLAREMMAAYEKEGRLPSLEPTLQEGSLAVYSDAPAGSLREALDLFLARGEKNCSYIALQAYVKPDPETGAALQALRQSLLTRTRLATTLGYGPRFLHSTGQLHKGDASKGLFIQFTADPSEDADIPDQPGAPESSISFAVLEAAQTLGDRQALLDAGRRVLRIHLGTDAKAGLDQVRRAVE